MKQSRSFTAEAKDLCLKKENVLCEQSIIKGQNLDCRIFASAVLDGTGESKDLPSKVWYCQTAANMWVSLFSMTKDEANVFASYEQGTMCTFQHTC